MQPWPAQTDEQFSVLDAGVQVAQVEAEQAEEAQKIRFQKADALEKTQLIGTQAQLGQTLDLMTNLGQIRTQILGIAATELPFDFDVGVVVQHRLHHRQLVEVGVEQVLHDAIGKHTLAHKRVSSCAAPGAVYIDGASGAYRRWGLPAFFQSAADPLWERACSRMRCVS